MMLYKIARFHQGDHLISRIFHSRDKRSYFDSVTGYTFLFEGVANLSGTLVLNIFNKKMKDT